MDGSFDGSSCFPGDRNAFHRHSQSGGMNHMGFMQPPPLPSPGQNSLNGLPRLPNGNGGSHDDLCVEQCSGIGLYNGSQFFNHRGAAPPMSARWSGRTMSTHHNPLLDYNPDLPDLDLMQFRQAMPPSHSNQYQAPWYAQQLQEGFGRRLRGGEEDGSEAETDSCCDSQCTMTGKCSNIACANKADICTDQSCPGRPLDDSSGLPSEVVNTAEVLLSINHGPEQQHGGFSLQGSGMSSFDFGSGQQFLWPLYNVADHLLNAHADPGSSSCTRPCLLDDPRNYPNCGMPIYNNLASFDTQYSTINTSVPINRNFKLCDAEVHDPETLLEHFNQQHRDFFAANNHQAPLGTTAMQHAGVMHSIEAMSSSPTTPLDPLESPDSDDSSNTPSPLTPMSNSVEMSEFKEEVSSPPDRSMSVISEDTQHKCLWREEGSGHICGQIFSGPEELFNHASTTHIKNAKKGDQGFRCGWADCPRSEAGAAGFPQRSKIERHMQTHIDHKPHVCHICNKGFSAKQALNQHMYIHTNQKPLECTICGKQFRYPSALTMHQRVHTGEKPLSCPICGKSFSESSNLSKHKRTHELKGRFSCRIPGCDRNFHRQDQLRRHMKTHQKESESGQDGMLATRHEHAFEQHAQD